MLRKTEITILTILDGRTHTCILVLRKDYNQGRWPWQKYTLKGFLRKLNRMENQGLLYLTWSRLFYLAPTVSITISGKEKLANAFKDDSGLSRGRKDCSGKAE